MYLIVGLGNPGDKYLNNRHNIGFQLIDIITDQKGLKLKKKFNAMFVKDSINNVLYCKPMTYMNESGTSINQIKNYYKIKSEDIFVMYDDLDLHIGRIKIQQGGGNAGHNGLKSIDTYIKGAYNKLRIGISRPEAGIQVSNYVLGDFKKEELQILAPALNFISENINILLKKDFVKFLNKYYLLNKK